MIGVIVLRFLKTLELKIKTVRRGTLTVAVASDGPTESEVRSIIRASEFEIVSTGSHYLAAEKKREWTCEIRWRALPHQADEPSFLKALEHLAGVKSLRWNPQGFRAYLEE